MLCIINGFIEAGESELAGLHMKIILSKTIPRSGATGLISSIRRTFESLPDFAATAYIKDADYLLSQGIQFHKEILQAASMPDFVLLKTHRTYFSLKTELDQISQNKPVLLNLFRSPFDVAISTYFYLIRKWSLIDPKSVSLFDYLQKWALKQGNDDIFINNGYPSYIQYAHHALYEKENYPEKVVSLSYHEATNERLNSFSKIIEAAYEGDDEFKRLLISYFTDFDLQQAKDTLGHNFVHAGGSNYIDDPEILSIIGSERVIGIKKLYQDCFGKTLERLNESFSLNLTCY